MRSTMKGTILTVKFGLFRWLKELSWVVTAWDGYSVGPCPVPHVLYRIQLLPAVCSVNTGLGFWRARGDAHVARQLCVRLAKTPYLAGATNVVCLVCPNWWSWSSGRDAYCNPSDIKETSKTILQFQKYRFENEGCQSQSTRVNSIDAREKTKTKKAFQFIIILFGRSRLSSPSPSHKFNSSRPRDLRHFYFL